MIFVDMDTSEEVALYMCVNIEEIHVLVDFLLQVERTSFADSEGRAGTTYTATEVGGHKLVLALPPTQKDLIDLDQVRDLLCG